MTNPGKANTLTTPLHFGWIVVCWFFQLVFFLGALASQEDGSPSRAVLVLIIASGVLFYRLPDFFYGDITHRLWDAVPSGISTAVSEVFRTGYMSALYVLVYAPTTILVVIYAVRGDSESDPVTLCRSLLAELLVVHSVSQILFSLPRKSVLRSIYKFLVSVGSACVWFYAETHGPEKYKQHLYDLMDQGIMIRNFEIPKYTTYGMEMSALLALALIYYMIAIVVKDRLIENINCADPHQIRH